MIDIEQLINTPLPVKIKYTGKSTRVRRNLQRLTVVAFTELNIGFLSENGSKGVQFENGDQMWIVDVAINYSFDTD
jgi:hypothetical protein